MRRKSRKRVNQNPKNLFFTVLAAFFSEPSYFTFRSIRKGSNVKFDTCTRIMRTGSAAFVITVPIYVHIHTPALCRPVCGILVKDSSV